MSAWIEQHISRVQRKKGWNGHQQNNHRKLFPPRKPSGPVARKVLVVIGDIWQSAAIFRENSPDQWQCEGTGPFLPWMRNLSLKESLRLVEAKRLEYEFHAFTPDAFKTLDIAV